MIFDKLTNYVLGAGLAVSVAFGAYAWVIHGHQRYVEGRADEKEHWESVIRRANVVIDQINREADKARDERDQVLTVLVTDVGKHKFAKVSAEIVKQCSLPDGVRKSLNSIAIRKQP